MKTKAPFNISSLWASIILLSPTIFSGQPIEWQKTNHWSLGIASEHDSLTAGTNSWRPYLSNINTWFPAHLGDIQWGVETNHITSGLILQYSAETNRTEVALFPILRSESTNTSGDGYSYSFWLLPLEHRYRMTLRDENGRLIPMTEWGKMHSEPFEVNMEKIDRYHGYERYLLRTDPQVTLFPSPLVLRDYFRITKAGIYRLEFEMTAVKKFYAERKIEVYRFPDDVQVDIRNP